MTTNICMGACARPVDECTCKQLKSWRAGKVEQYRPPHNQYEAALNALDYATKFIIRSANNVTDADVGIVLGEIKKLQNGISIKP